MKIKHRTYEKGMICYGFKNAYLINQHLLECDKIKTKNYEYLVEIRSFFTKYELDYNLTDVFFDYGLKILVR